MEIYGQTAGKNQKKVHGQSGTLYYCMADTDIRTAAKKRNGGDNAGYRAGRLYLCAGTKASELSGRWWQQ